MCAMGAWAALMTSEQFKIITLEEAEDYLARVDESAETCSVPFDPSLLVCEGYELWPDLTRKLGWLTSVKVEFVEYDSVGHVWFDPVEAASTYTNIDRVRDHEARVGSRLIPVGGVDASHMMLLLSETGSVYGCFDDHLWFVGESPIEAIKNIANGTTLEEHA